MYYIFCNLWRWRPNIVQNPVLFSLSVRYISVHLYSNNIDDSTNVKKYFSVNESLLSAKTHCIRVKAISFSTKVPIDSAKTMEKRAIAVETYVNKLTLH